MMTLDAHSSPFVRATTWGPLAEGQYYAQLSPAWLQGRGMYGGMLGGGILRAMLHRLQEPARLPRSLTVHFCGPALEGEAQLAVQVERAGRQVTHLSARLTQWGNTVCLASATFALSRPTDLAWGTEAPPRVPPAEELPPVPSELLPPFAQNFDYRLCAGAPPFSGASEALVGAWIRPRVATPLDAPLAVGLLDVLPPAASARVDGFCNLATMDFTAHFYAPLPLASAAPDAFYLRVGRSQHAASGYADDLAGLWSADGRPLAQLRQMAAIFA